MGRRKKKKPKSQSIYLNSDYDDIEAFFRGSKTDMITLPDAVKFPRRPKPVMGTMGGFPAVNNNPNMITYQAHNHTGDDVIFELDGKQLFAANWQGLQEYSDKWDLIIDLAGNVKSAIIPTRFVKNLSTFTSKDELEALVHHSQPIKMSAQLLSLDWLDMNAPPVGLEFWLALWANLPARTVIACQGGHGRTGTCLAALMITTGFSYQDAVEHVRAKHCKKAIETQKQEDYLFNLYLDVLRESGASEVDLTAAETQNPAAGAVGANVQAFNSEPELMMGKVLATRNLNGRIENQRCTNQKCTNFDCHVPAHLTWVLYSVGG